MSNFASTIPLGDTLEQLTNVARIVAKDDDNQSFTLIAKGAIAAGTVIVAALAINTFLTELKSAKARKRKLLINASEEGSNKKQNTTNNDNTLVAAPF